MATILDPKTGIVVAAPFRASLWEDAKRCRRWLTFFASRVVANVACATLPDSPAEGQTVVMAPNASANPNAIARYSSDLSAWEYLTPWNGLAVTDAAGVGWAYTASGWGQQAAGGSSSSLPTWISAHPRTPPATPNAWDDEFDGASLGADWSWVNQGGATVQMVNSGLLLTAALGNGFDLRSVAKSAPGAAPWEVTTYLDNVSAEENVNAVAGLGVRNATTGEIQLLSVEIGGSYWTLSVNPFTYDGSTHIKGWASATLNISASRGTYLRVRSDGTNLIFSASMDGYAWDEIGRQTIAQTVGSADQIVLGAYSYSTMWAGRLWADFVRRTA